MPPPRWRHSERFEQVCFWETLSLPCCPRVLFKLLPPSKGAFRSTNTGKETPFESLEWLLIGRKIIGNERPGQAWELFQILIQIETWRNQVDVFLVLFETRKWKKKKVVYAHVMKHKEKLYALHCCPWNTGNSKQWHFAPEGTNAGVSNIRPGHRNGKDFFLTQFSKMWRSAYRFRFFLTVFS